MKIKVITGSIVTAIVMSVCAVVQQGSDLDLSTEVFAADISFSSAADSINSASIDKSVNGAGEDESAKENESNDMSKAADSEADASSEAKENDGRKKVNVKATGDVLIDKDGFYAEITDKKTDEFGYSWDIHCVNNTGDTVYFGMESVSVNGVMAIPPFQAEVGPGASADGTASWYMDLKEYGIETPVVIEGKISIIDKETYALLSQAQFTVCPEGEENAYYVTRAAGETDTNIINNDYVSFLGAAFGHDEYENAVMDVYLNNKSDKDIIISIDGCFINDAEADPFWAAFLPAGKSVYTNIYWSLADLKVVGIDSFESINKLVAEISVYNMDTFETYSNDIVTLSFE